MVREALFNICQNEIAGARFLDLCAGTGAMGFEALSRGALTATFVERDPAACRCIAENAKQLGVEIELIPTDLFAALARLEKGGRQFDILYADPPYGKGREGRLYAEELLDWCSSAHLLPPGASLFIEEGETIETNWPGLQLISHRRHGRAQLYQFRRQPHR